MRNEAGREILAEASENLQIKLRVVEDHRQLEDILPVWLNIYEAMSYAIYPVEVATKGIATAVHLRRAHQV